jgi:hypothetical protein
LLIPSNRSNPENPEDGSVRSIAEKSYELCASAANRITSIRKHDVEITKIMLTLLPMNK